MSFETMRNTLVAEFNNNNFKEKVEDGLEYTDNYQVPNNYNINLTISYPGYKAKINNYGLVYDYRVNLNDIAISHVNIIVDLYNKGLILEEQQISYLEELLFDLAYNGDNYNRENFSKIDSFKFQPPSNELINRVENKYNKLGKSFNSNGNINWNYSLDELATSIMWIVLQEDINYPIENGFEGRKMSFKRYLEALYCCHNKEKEIDEVIERALKKGSPPKDWNRVNINYNKVNNLN